ncbi:MAG: ribonuclease D [Candidatus Obscuribacterales bacterium]
MESPKSDSSKRNTALITDPKDLEEVVALIEEAGVFGLDLEFIPERTYFPIICLVQIAVQDKVFLVDPIELKDLQILWKTVADSRIVKVLHAASQDLMIIFQRSGLIPKNIFDTQIAAGFLGLGYPAGYGKLLAALFDLNLSKTESFTDWQARPLSRSQIEYAIDDALHLIPLYERLQSELEGRKRLDWVIEECKHYEQDSYYIKESGREFLRVKGAQGLNRRKLAVLQAVCLWREAEAKRTDRPARSVINDNIMLELAKKPPSSIEDIQRIRGIRSDQLSHWGRKVVKVIEEANQIADKDCPQWPSGRAPSKADVLIADVLYTVLKIRALDLEIAPELIATRDELQGLVKIGRDIPEVNHLESDNMAGDEGQNALTFGWRRRLAGNELIKVLCGTPIKVTISDSSTNPIAINLCDGN